MDWLTVILTIGGWMAGALTVLAGSHYTSTREAHRDMRRNVEAAMTDLLNGVTALTLDVSLEQTYGRRVLEDIFKAVDRLTVLDMEAGRAAVDFRSSALDFLLVGPDEFELLTDEERAARLSSFHAARQQLLDEIHARLDRAGQGRFTAWFTARRASQNQRA